MGFLDQVFNFLFKALCAPAKEQVQQQPYPTQQQQQQQNQWQQQQPHTPHKPHTSQHHEQPVSYPPKQEEKPHQQYGKPYYHNDYMAHAQDPTYVNLRKEAEEAGDEMGRLFGESKAAYERGDGAEAKRLSDEAKQLRANRERLHKKAADWIYEENNKERGPEEIDLHGLRAEEAVERTDQAVIVARRRGLDELRLIVGKGVHSQNHKAVLKPKIEELMRKHNLAAEIDPDNSGVLVVHLDGQTRTGRGIDPGEITNRLEDDNKNCIIM